MGEPLRHSNTHSHTRSSVTSQQVKQQHRERRITWHNMGAGHVPGNSMILDTHTSSAGQHIVTVTQLQHLCHLAWHTACQTWLQPACVLSNACLHV
jgi:hypothetical protein